MAKQLAKRDITSQYRQSILGFFWVLFPVIMNALVWIFLQRTGTVKLSDTGIPYPLFALVGTTIWSVFNECLNMPIKSVNGNRAIISKINFDKEGLITLGFIKLCFNLLIKIGLIIFFILYFDVIPSGSIFLFIPLILIVFLLFISLGVLLVPLGVLYKDIGRMIPVGMQLLMYITPVLYIMPKSGFMHQVMRFNPLSYFISDIRNCLTGLPVAHAGFWLVALSCAVVLSVLATVVYRVSMPIITERMSA
ncbi:ABC transporter permease [Aestuariibaculum sp. M13]|uniref:ABC transporter permease n=1 Tax=Aestuariibaculum sp. M13 TaxID=2967132 RepID=UPI002159F94F|nr:ABC transporter permease [Aestuariibaculum sp. M13]MCR8666372.1 ABC transporter permease [Aestuariibaculum sp. M13]